jgi:hypothetical protein
MKRKKKDDIDEISEKDIRYMLDGCILTLKRKAKKANCKIKWETINVRSTFDNGDFLLVMNADMREIK